MNVLTLAGLVEDTAIDYDGWYVSNVEGPSIGGERVIAAFEKKWPTNRQQNQEFTLMLAVGGDEQIHATGTTMFSEGDHGYSSLTPGHGAEILMWHAPGEVLEITEKLAQLDGKTVTLRIDDGPVPS